MYTSHIQNHMCTIYVQSVRLIHLAVSLGGVESLVEHAASMTHGNMIMTDLERKEVGILDGLIRFRLVACLLEHSLHSWSLCWNTVCILGVCVGTESAFL